MKYAVIEMDDGTAIIGAETTMIMRGGLSMENREHTYFKKIGHFSSVQDAFQLLKEAPKSE